MAIWYEVQKSKEGIVNFMRSNSYFHDYRIERIEYVAGKDYEINPDLEKFIIDSALGLTDTEADLAFRLAKEKVGLNRPECVQIIANEKEQIIKKSGILDYIPVNMSLNDTKTESCDNLVKNKNCSILFCNLTKERKKIIVRNNNTHICCNWLHNKSCNLVFIILK